MNALWTPTDTQPGLQDHSGLFRLLDIWVEHNWLTRLDRACAHYLAEMEPDCSPLALLTAALTSHQAGFGHLCLDLSACLQQPNLFLRMPPPEQALPVSERPITPEELLAPVNADQWQTALMASDAFSATSASPWRLDVVRDEKSLRLLVYQNRFFKIEQQLANDIAQRLVSNTPPAAPETIAPLLASLFPDALANRADGQKLACATAVSGDFSVITGGPGTGKTTTVVRLLALLYALHPEGKPPLSVALCAPTGKAAARLNESIQAALAQLSKLTPPEGKPDGFWQDIGQQITPQAQTLHRLLGLGGFGGAKYHRQHPLVADVVIVDEASMVSVGLMAQLFDALPATTRLILLGDKDQLASVEPGALLGALCQQAQRGALNPALQQWLSVATELPVDKIHARQANSFPPPVESSDNTLDDPLGDRIALLDQSHRFSSDSAIGKLAQAVNQGVFIEALNLLQADQPDLDASTVNSIESKQLSAFFNQWFQKIKPWQDQLAKFHCHGIDPQKHDDLIALEEIFTQAGAFSVLCAVRRGPAGVETLNQQIEQRLVAQPSNHFVGRLVMVTRNDRQLDLANGDIGLMVPVKTDAGVTLKVAFRKSRQQFAFIHPGRLADIQSAFAITVHKSQGSEFGQVQLVLPDRPNPVLTRELVYTAITRAKQQFRMVVLGPKAHEQHDFSVLRYSIQTQTRRDGNLTHRIHSAYKGAKCD